MEQIFLRVVNYSFAAGWLVAAVLILPMCWAATKAMSCNVSVTKNFVVNIIFMVGILFLFSAFRYSAVYVVIIAAVLHIAAMVWVLGTSVPHDKKHTKRVKENDKSLFGIFRSDGSGWRKKREPSLICI